MCKMRPDGPLHPRSGCHSNAPQGFPAPALSFAGIPYFLSETGSQCHADGSQAAYRSRILLHDGDPAHGV